jgi:hypothetical protein
MQAFQFLIVFVWNAGPCEECRFSRYRSMDSTKPQTRIIDRRLWGRERENALSSTVAGDTLRDQTRDYELEQALRAGLTICKEKGRRFSRFVERPNSWTVWVRVIRKLSAD